MKGAPSTAASYDETLRAIRDWPVQRRLELIGRLLEQIDTEELEPRRRMPAAGLADGLLASPDRQAPSDDEIAHWLHEIRLARTS